MFFPWCLHAMTPGRRNTPGCIPEQAPRTSWFTSPQKETPSHLSFTCGWTKRNYKGLQKRHLASSFPMWLRCFLGTCRPFWCASGDVSALPFGHGCEVWSAVLAWKSHVHNTASPDSCPFALTPCSKVCHQLLPDPDRTLFWQEREETSKLGKDSIQDFHTAHLFHFFFFFFLLPIDSSTWPVKSVPSVKVTRHCTAAPAPWITISHTQLKLMPPLACLDRHSCSADHISELHSSTAVQDCH